MIYELVERDEPIQQGDIFRDAPRIDISLDDFTVVETDEQTASVQPRALSWLEAIQNGDGLSPSSGSERQQPFIQALLPVTRVCAIIITQNCDALRAEDLSLCEIAPLARLNKEFGAVTSPKRIAMMLTKQDSGNVRWFYLPPDPLMPFKERMGVDFRSVLRLPRSHLETMRELRVGRLIPLACEHFREKLASFFRRYAYDAWYPLNKEEFEAYEKDYPGSPPFPWQRWLAPPVQLPHLFSNSCLPPAIPWVGHVSGLDGRAAYSLYRWLMVDYPFNSYGFTFRSESAYSGMTNTVGPAPERA